MNKNFVYEISDGSIRMRIVSIFDSAIFSNDLDPAERQVFECKPAVLIA